MENGSKAPKAIRMAPEGAPNPQGLALYVITEEIIVSLPALTHRQRGMIKRRERGEREGGGGPAKTRTGGAGRAARDPEPRRPPSRAARPRPLLRRRPRAPPPSGARAPPAPAAAPRARLPSRPRAGGSRTHPRSRLMLLEAAPRISGLFCSLFPPSSPEIKAEEHLEVEKVPLLVGWIQKEATVYILGGGRKDFFFLFWFLHC